MMIMKVWDDQFHSITPENVIAVHHAIVKDQRQIIDICNISHGIMVRQTSADLSQEFNLRTAAKFMPWLLSDEQKPYRINVSRELTELLWTYSDFLSKVVTSDGCWIYGYDPETKQQSSQWKNLSSPQPKKMEDTSRNVQRSGTVMIGSFTATVWGHIPVSYTHLDVYKRQGRERHGDKKLEEGCSG